VWTSATLWPSTSAPWTRWCAGDFFHGVKHGEAQRKQSQESTPWSHNNPHNSPRLWTTLFELRKQTPQSLDD
jgi:hypothetical protein